jgi:Flp pilus assembly pilin Flp
MHAIVTKITALRHDHRAVTALEYGIIAGVLGLALVAIFSKFGGTMSVLFGSIGTQI